MKINKIIKYFIIIASLIFVLSLTTCYGCGDQGNENNTQTSTNTSITNTATTSKKVDTTESEETAAQTYSVPTTAEEEKVEAITASQ
jgi:uncharacterized protein YpmB